MVAVALVLGGVIILLIERWSAAPAVDDVNDVPPRTALGIGLAQVLSLVPGHVTIRRHDHGRLCSGAVPHRGDGVLFLLAIPVMLAATTYDLAKSWSVLTPGDFPMFAVGFIVSFVSAVFVVKAFLAYVSGHSFAVFAWYRIIFGLVLWFTL